MQDFHAIEVLDDDGIVITDLDQHSESSTQIPAINSCYLQVASLTSGPTSSLAQLSLNLDRDIVSVDNG